MKLPSVGLMAQILAEQYTLTVTVTETETVTETVTGTRPVPHLVNLT